MLNHPPKHQRLGFTLIEMLVVISIIAIVVGTSFSYLRGMVRDSAVQMAANSTVSAVTGARAYATRYVPFTNPLAGPGQTADDDGDGYSGAAVIFTPANELRIVENDQNARDAGGEYLELRSSSSDIYNGYKPIDDLDDLRIAASVAMVGITRNSGTGNLELLPPPFAISFNNRGLIVARTTTTVAKRSDGYVYYDSDGDGIYDINDDRQAVDLTDYQRGVASLTPDGLRELPWHKIDPVVGVAFFNPRDITAIYDPSKSTAYTSTDATDLLREIDQKGGKILLFNRNTGTNMAE